MADENVVILQTPSEQSDDELTSLENLAKDETPPVIDKNAIVVKNDKKIIFYIMLSAIVAILVIVAIFVFFASKDETPPQNVAKKPQKAEIKTKITEFAPNTIDDMIKKANSLYASGNRNEALKIYENISLYNEAISSYNLGVSQMQQNNYDAALNSFKKSISNNENMAMSAINAAVCALELNNNVSFEYYINLANSFLQNEANSPLFNYYIALINFYKGYYVEALHALNHCENEQYKGEFAYLRAKILAFLGKENDSILDLEKQGNFPSNFTTGLMQARLGNFAKAKEFLKKARSSEPNRERTNMALAILSVRMGLYQDAADLLFGLFKTNKNLPNSIYPTKIILNPQLFDINLAQKNFSNHVFAQKSKRYEMLFYFAPYKIFDAQKAIELTRKGAINVFLDDINEGKKLLNSSQTIAKVNAKLAQSIAKAFNDDLREANAELVQLVSVYKLHSIVHYNLALSYAKLMDFTNAAKFFTSAYHLDPKNHTAGVFAVICNDLLNQKNPKLLAEVSENLSNDSTLLKGDIAPALLYFKLDNLNALINWLQTPKETTALNLALETIIARMSENEELFLKKANALNSLLPDDIMANIVNFTAKNHTLGIKDFATSVQINIQNNKFNLQSFYYGSQIVKEHFVKLLQISGFLHKIRDELKNLILSSPNDPKFLNLLETLAYIDIFTNDFEESYALYNQLISSYKLSDHATIFHAAVAAVGAKQPQNAIAMLELSRITNPNDPESRMALAMLYQSINNIDAAINQYRKLENIGTTSEFFILDIADKND